MEFVRAGACGAGRRGGERKREGFGVGAGNVRVEDVERALEEGECLARGGRVRGGGRAPSGGGCVQLGCAFAASQTALS